MLDTEASVINQINQTASCRFWSGGESRDKKRQKQSGGMSSRMKLSTGNYRSKEEAPSQPDVEGGWEKQERFSRRDIIWPEP